MIRDSGLLFWVTLYSLRVERHVERVEVFARFAF